MPEVYVETYLGCDIYHYTPPNVVDDQYGSPCLTSNYKKLSAVKKRICISKGGTWVDGVCDLAPPTEPAEFRFDSWSPPLDTREIFSTKAGWPSVSAKYDVGDSVYVHYCVKNVGDGAGKAKITVKDLDTGATVTTWSLAELNPGYRFKTSGSGAYVGKMPAKEWRLEFKVTP